MSPPVHAGRATSRIVAVPLGLVLLVLALAGCSPARTIEAAGLLSDIAGRHAPAAVQRASVTYRGEQEVRRADLYASPETRSALVLVPGAAEGAMDDPRLIRFADALRRRGFRVLVPELGGGDFLQVSADDADAIADAARHLLATADPDRVGMAALSYAVGPTIRAALQPGIRDNVGFIVAIGGYHSILAGITYLTTGAFREGPDAPWRHAEIDPRAKWIFLQANTGWIDDPEDARTLEAIARARLDRPDVGVAGLVAQLGPEGRAVYEVFANRDPDAVPGLIGALPQRVRDEIAALDLSALDLDRLRADLILIHGLDDPLVPYTESASLARATGADSSDLYLLRGLKHVDVTAPGPADLATLLRAAYRVLSERDADAPREDISPALP